MSYSKLIHDYLDGELDATQQDSLFSQLAVDPAVRGEFHQQMKLHVITQSDMSTISPPMESTNAIFSALGFSIPSGSFSGVGASTAATSGIGTALWIGLKKYVPYVLTTVVATVITALILFYLFDKNSGRKDDMSSSSQAHIPYTASFEKSNMPQVAAPQTEILTKREIERLFVKTFRETIQNMLKNPAFANYVPMNLASNQQVVPPQDGNSNDNNKTISSSRRTENSYLNPLMTPNLDSKDIQYANYLNQQFNYSPYFDFTDSKDNTKLSLELRNMTARSNPDINLPASSNPWFANMSAALMYEFDKNHSLGVSVGQEQFAQSFTRFTDNIVYSYKQNPLLFWYGLTYKLTLSELLYANVIYPYATVTLGGTTVGPQGRVQVGLQYQPDKRVTFILGAEASAMYYNVQNNIYTSTKYGLTYGIGIHY